MAILTMKQLRCFALQGQREALLKELQALGCVELRTAQPPREDLQAFTVESDQLRRELQEAEQVLRAVGGTGGASSDPQRGKAALRAGSASLKKLETLREQMEAQKAQMGALTPWADWAWPLERTTTDATQVRLYVASLRLNWAALIAALEPFDAAVQEIGHSSRDIRFCLVIHRGDVEEVAQALIPFGLSAVTFPGLTGTAAENIQRLTQAQEAAAKARQEEEEALQRLGEERGAMEAYVTSLRNRLRRSEAASQLLGGERIVYFEGYFPLEREAALAALLEAQDCAWETREPAEEEYGDVPISLRNNPLTEPMNMVTEMYALPRYGTVDPNPLMAPFFVLFFGMMLADMGYGILMVLAGVYWRLKPRKSLGHLPGIALLCGISTFVWGALTGSFFGDFPTQLASLLGREFALPALFSPLDDALMVLLGSLVLGLLQIFTGMAVSVYLKCRRGEWMAALCQEGAWYAAFVCIGVGAFTGAWSAALWTALAILVLTQSYGRKGILGKLMGIFGGLYNGITGYFSDILSYARLMALMLAGAVIAQVFNTLGAITGNIFLFLIISFLGNALNFGLNLLGCYVHDLRLQCLEYFGRFYEDGGRPFQPLRTEDTSAY